MKTAMAMLFASNLFFTVDSPLGFVGGWSNNAGILGIILVGTITHVWDRKGVSASISPPAHLLARYYSTDTDTDAIRRRPARLWSKSHDAFLCGWVSQHRDRLNQPRLEHVRPTLTHSASRGRDLDRQGVIHEHMNTLAEVRGTP